MTKNTNRTAQMKRVARYLRGCTKTGIYNNMDALEHGVPIGFDGDEPKTRIPLETVEERIKAMENEDLRTRIQVRLGLSDYRPWSMTERQLELARLYDRRQAAQQRATLRSPPPGRSATDRLSEAAADALLGGSPLTDAPAYESTRLLYSRSVTLPPGNVGEVEEVHRRIIRAEVDGLDRILVHQTEHWNSFVTATTRGMGSAKVRPVRIREDEHNGIRGERLDVEITFPALNIGDPPRELQWTRRRQLEPGWLSDSRSMVFASAPDHPTDLMVIEIQFGEGALPKTVTRFTDVYPGDRLDPDIPVALVPLRDEAVRCEWQHPRIGLASGIRVWW